MSFAGYASKNIMIIRPLFKNIVYSRTLSYRYDGVTGKLESFDKICCCWYKLKMNSLYMPGDSNNLFFFFFFAIYDIILLKLITEEDMPEYRESQDSAPLSLLITITCFLLSSSSPTHITSTKNSTETYKIWILIMHLTSNGS